MHITFVYIEMMHIYYIMLYIEEILTWMDDKPKLASHDDYQQAWFYG